MWETDGNIPENLTVRPTRLTKRTSLLNQCSLRFHACGAALLTVLCLFAPIAQAQQSPNTNQVYHQLRGLLPAGPSLNVQNLVLKRDAATFTFNHGGFVFFGEVNGKVTGAVFGGSGHLHLTPPTATEAHSLQILTKKPEFDEDFSQVVLRFTDGTAEELRKAAGVTAGGSDSSLVQAAMEFRTFQRDHLHENVDLRLLEDVLSPAPGGFFLAAIHGSSNPHILFEIDPHGAPDIAPEEVRLETYNAWGWTIPAAFHLAPEYAGGTASGRQENYAFKVDDENLDTTIEKSGFLSAQAAVHLHAVTEGVAVVPLTLYPTLRVSKVEDEHGEVLDFVQERKEDDPNFGLVLAHPLKKGESATVKITYGGKDAVRSVGGDNYDPIARESWFPNGGTGFGSYSIYTMRFHTPKEIELIATGNKLSDKVDGKIRTTEWASKVPLPVAGFHLGRFAEKSGKTPDGIEVDAYANSELPDWASSVAHAASGDALPSQISHGGSMAVGTLSTTGMLPVELSEGTSAVQIYESLFGKLPFDHLALSQQPACTYGQSWPMLVYLPICGFWDGTIQHQFGLRPEDPYWKTVTAHEIAHQWWGHTVGFASYRDQWMSEGFADASASIFLQMTRKNGNDFRDFWKQLKTQLTERNSDGFRPIDVGPVTMGYRLSSSKTGWGVYNNLVYPKGAYILHMIRMMMYSPKTGDEDFRAMMHDFTDTYQLKVATTEDFKAMVEKHMTSGMDLDHSHTMDWFFNEYVYGTALPQLHFESLIKSNSDADQIYFKLTQSGVSDSFKMVVPIYLELNDGRTIRLGSVSMYGNTSTEKTVQLGKPAVPVKRAVIDYMHDVLAIEN
jgi:Peptidase family M1 domain